jgi:hypothetical protein
MGFALDYVTSADGSFIAGFLIGRGNGTLGTFIMALVTFHSSNIAAGIVMDMGTVCPCHRFYVATEFVMTVGAVAACHRFRIAALRCMLSMMLT